MKKTLKTAMTSAMFAAAIGIAAGNLPHSNAAAGQDAPADEELLMNATAGEMEDVYGPPSWFTEPEEPDVTEMDDGHLPGMENRNIRHASFRTSGIIMRYIDKYGAECIGVFIGFPDQAAGIMIMMSM